MTNSYENEINKFDSQYSSWWDQTGPFKSLHDINALRTEFINNCCEKLTNKTVLDVGCGGGILSESLALENAQVTGIDPGGNSIKIAKSHAHASNLSINYQTHSLESFHASNKTKFDIITCMEMLEHTQNPDVCVAHCAELTKPGGDLFFSTFNRNLKSFMYGIVAAEYILGLLPRGTHHYQFFIKPSELATWARKHGLQLQTLNGISYNPWNKSYSLVADTSINYIAHFTKP